MQDEGVSQLKCLELGVIAHETPRGCSGRFPLRYRDSIGTRALARIYPQLVVAGIRSFGSPDVMRFVGKNIPAHGQLHRRFAGEVVSDLKDRPEGVRIKHRVNSNSIKLYDKHGSVLRVETTLNDPRPFTVYRTSQGNPDRRPSWLP